MTEVSLATIGVFNPEPGTDQLPTAPGFGIRADGSAYYNPDGAAPGEAAWLRLDPSGALALEQHAPSVLFGAIRVLMSSPLPANTQLRLVAVCDCGEIVTRPGELCARCAAPHTLNVEAGDARPVAQPDPVTRKLIRKTGSRTPKYTVRPPRAHTGRPVEQPDAQPAELREGRPVDQPAPETAPLRHGRPVDQPAPVTARLRKGRPVKQPAPVTIIHPPRNRERTY